MIQKTFAITDTKLFVLVVTLSFKDDRTVHTKRYLPNVELNDYNVMMDEQNFFDHPVKNNLETYGNILTIPIGPKYNYFDNYIIYLD